MVVSPFGCRNLNLQACYLYSYTKFLFIAELHIRHQKLVASNSYKKGLCLAFSQ